MPRRALSEFGYCQFLSSRLATSLVLPLIRIATLYFGSIFRLITEGEFNHREALTARPTCQTDQYLSTTCGILAFYISETQTFHDRSESKVAECHSVLIISRSRLVIMLVVPVSSWQELRHKKCN